MKQRSIFILFLSNLVLSCTSVPSLESLKNDDKYLWLETRANSQVDQWIQKQNSETKSRLTSHVAFQKKLKTITELVSKKSALPNFEVIGRHLYSLYHPNPKSHGIWKRTSLDNPEIDFSKWETVLDIGKLNKKRKKNYSLGGVSCLRPLQQLCLLSLAIDGGDTKDVFEFDLKTKQFVIDGFSLIGGKTTFSWVDENTLLASADFGKETLLSSGFGSQLRFVRRKGGPDSEPIVKAPKDFLGIFLNSFESLEGTPVSIATPFYSETNSENWIIEKEKVVKVPVPSGTSIKGIFQGDIVATLKSEWNVGGKIFYPGDVVAFSKYGILNNSRVEKIHLIFRPSKKQSTGSFIVASKNFLAIETIENVQSNIVYFKKTGNKYIVQPSNLKNILNSRIYDYSFSKDLFFVKSENFTTPPNILLFNPKTSTSKTIFQENSLFNSKNVVTEQKWVKSVDGTLVPYYLVGKKKSLQSNNAKVFLQGYGGYGYNMFPKYDAIYGKLWLEKGGVLAVANVRGGGEFGPHWYLDGIKEKKINSINDFLAVSKSILDSNLTTEKHLGIYSGSAGGVLVGGAMVLKPEYFKAVAAVIPVLDLLRNNELSKGGNWRGEYGDPSDPKYRKAILEYSPYYNLKANIDYPSFFSFATTTDERAHPAHARKMVAKMQDLDNDNVYYYENSEGGHKGSSNNEQRAFWKALLMEFFTQELGLDETK